MNLLEELGWREALYDHTEGLPEALASDPLSAYVGFDPTAVSLHVGSLLPVMGLARLQRAGHTPIALVGGGTGLIGDPSGKAHERQLLNKEKVEENAQGIRRQLSRFLDFEAQSNPAQMVNNADWLAEVALVDFLREVGKHFTVNAMMAKESVKRRIGQEEGITYTEFSYMLLQSYDFVVLNDRLGCTLQMGGSDQWGNITSGIDLLRRMRGKRAYGMVFPLVASSSGVKFGKTEAGAVWLDPEMTSPYRFYQFWLNSGDDDVVTYLKYFTWLTRQEIDGLESDLELAPEKRQAQRRLAREVTRMVHGQTECANAELASEVLFGGQIEGLNAQQVEDIFSDVPSSELEAEALNRGILLTEVLAKSGLASSKGEARRLIQGGGIYLNNRRVTDVKGQARRQDCIEGRFLVLRKGSKNYHLLRAK